LRRYWTPNLDSTTLLYYGTIDHDRDGILVDEDLDNGEAAVDDSRQFDLWAVAQSFNYAFNNRVHAEFGGRYTHQRGRYDYVGSIQRGELADFLGTDLNETRAYQLRPEGGSGGLFATLRVQAAEPLVVEAGLRWDFQDYTGSFDGQVSPRLSVRYDIGEDTELRFSAGRFFQPEGIHELQVGDGITEYQSVQHADHYIAAWHQRFADSGWSMRMELFSKRFRDPKARYENLFNPLVLLPELAADRVRIAPSQARARGFETTLRYERPEHLLAWLTYSKTDAEERINGTWQPRAWDQGDTVSAGLNWQLGQWTIGATLLWHEGWRTTRLPAEAADGEVLPVQRNAARLRDYMSLDLQISREWQWSTQSLTAFLEITNLLNRRNVGGIEYDVEEDEETGLYVITSEPEELLPLVPSIGIRWQF
jgi:outer membrane receptor protein involved in Fe transport